MKIISHRGYWKTESEKNSEKAFRRSFELGFGTETDIRDLDGEIVISHDVPTKKDKPMSFSEFLSIYSDYNFSGDLALNIKSDGLQEYVKETLGEFFIENYYLFDMTIPDMVVTKRHGLRYLSRKSDLETFPILLGSSVGVWFDELYTEWITPNEIKEILNMGKKVFIVSSELHGRKHHQQWSCLYDEELIKNENLILCTDHPEEAQEFFKEDKGVDKSSYF